MSDMRSTTGLLFARYALAVAFLSAVADRFGLWGSKEVLGVDWGDMQTFYGAVAQLNPWVPEALIPALSWFVTILEAVLGVLLIIGYRLRVTALVSAVLLLIFALTMSVFLSIKLPLNYSVFTAAACAFLVYLHEEPGIDRE